MPPRFPRMLRRCPRRERTSFARRCPSTLPLPCPLRLDMAEPLSFGGPVRAPVQSWGENRIGHAKKLRWENGRPVFRSSVMVIERSYGVKQKHGKFFELHGTTAFFLRPPFAAWQVVRLGAGGAIMRFRLLGVSKAGKYAIWHALAFGLAIWLMASGSSNNLFTPIPALILG